MTFLAEELVRISEQGAAAVLATVVEVQGNTAIEPGAKCLVRDGAVVGETLGDPRVLEAVVQESAVRLRAASNKQPIFPLLPTTDRREANHVVLSPVAIADSPCFHSHSVWSGWLRCQLVSSFSVTGLPSRFRTHVSLPVHLVPPRPRSLPN